jgi:hypothetical protein
LANSIAGSESVIGVPAASASRQALPRRAGLVGALDAQIDEIRADPALRVFGLVLALVNVLSVYAWWSAGEQILFTGAVEPICWPLVPGCAAWRGLTLARAESVLTAFAALSLVAALGFAFRRLVPAGYFLLALATLAKVALLAFDYRLRLNQHYMALWAAAVFLLVPGKRDALRVLLVLFYFWAGSLKLNWEWISGAALYRPIWLFTGRGVMVACAYVVVLELIVVWGLLARRPWIFWTSFAQVLLFHVMSWAVVGFFYPTLMFGLLTIFPLARAWPRDGDDQGLLVPLARGRLRPAVYATLAAFSLPQLVPYAYPGDSAVTGEGRLYALHMFDARVTCDAYADVRTGDGGVQRVSLRRGAAVRIDCDPIVLYGRARNLCEHRSRLVQDVADLDLHLRARRTTDPVLHEVVDVRNFCAQHLRYDPFRHNPWIEAS